MMGGFSCAGKEIQVQSAGVARRLWRGGRCGLMTLLLVMLLGPAMALAARVPAGPAEVRQTTPDKSSQGDPTFLPAASAGFDGLTKAGRWLSIRAVVSNDGPPLDGQLR